MAITGDTKRQLRSRLVKAQGHLAAVVRMIDDEKYCIDVLTQLKAVQAALDKTAQLMLKQHLDTCVVEAVKADDSARVMDELWQLLRRGEASLEEESEDTEVDSKNQSNSQSKAQSGCCH
ncbi:MAG: metal-sensitive transcriptional regulator [Candidatus Melainabacteria bacterium]|nr:metal-sensitive transcriptional regulator [Candidatus Melainabacteria bacterium]